MELFCCYKILKAKNLKPYSLQDREEKTGIRTKTV